MDSGATAYLCGDDDRLANLLPRLPGWEDAIMGSGDRGRRQPSQEWTPIDSASAVARTGLSGFIDGY